MLPAEDARLRRPSLNGLWDAGCLALLDAAPGCSRRSKTGEQKYRDQGWAIFQAFQKHSRAAGGYAGLRDVRTVPAQHDGVQQSYFLAETLKYLYLLFADWATARLGPAVRMPPPSWCARAARRVCCACWQGCSAPAGHHARCG